MASLPVGKNHHAGPLLAQHARYLQAVLPGVFNPAIGDVQRTTPCDVQDACRFGGLTCAVIGCAAGAHLSARKIENPSAMPQLRHLQQRAAAGLLGIVAVSGNRENVQRHRVIGTSGHRVICHACQL